MSCCFCRSLFPCGDDMVAIIDDREDVWNYSANVVPVLPYKFFRGNFCINLRVIHLFHSKSYLFYCLIAV